MSAVRTPAHEVRGEGKVEPLDGRVHITLPAGGTGYLNVTTEAAKELAGQILVAALVAEGRVVNFPLRWTFVGGATDWREELAERLGGKGAVLCPTCEGALGFDCDACPQGRGYVKPQEGER